MKIKFCGAARQVTGSAHLITLDNGYTILLDCGLYQGNDKDMESFNSNWYFDPKSIDCLILSHSHIDHSGRVPKLVKDGFRGNIYCTHATRQLSALMLLDSAKIQERDAEYFNKRQSRKKKGIKKAFRQPLYKAGDVPLALQQFVSLSYGRWYKIHDDVTLCFRDAGHILGSASVTLTIKEGDREVRLGFTADVGRPNRPILRDPVPMPEVDYLICESTYGAKDHDEPPAESVRLLEIIQKTCVEKKGKLIIPAFSVGRTQEIVYMLDKMETAGQLPRIPVYVDSPLAVNATTIYGAHPECFDNDLHEYLLIDDNPFGFNNLTYVKDVAVSKSLNNSKKPCIIISSSGMMNAGRVKHHLANNIEDKRNTLLIVGYCSPDTPGGMLRNGIDKLKLFGEWKTVRADIEVMDSFSAHADRHELVHFIENQKPGVKKVFLVHGELESQEKFRTLLNENGFEDVLIPELGKEFNL
ncbi:MAG: MBL fold metallo-hydrolase [Bacteroidota bacterium]